MYRNNRVGVVIPAYKEELLIVPTLESVPDFVDRIYAVNDASPDNTGALIDSYTKKDSRVVPIHHPRNRGVGAAIISGYKQALADGMDYVAVMAGDNQMDPIFLPELLDPVVDGVADYSVGNRLVNERVQKRHVKVAFYRELDPHSAYKRLHQVLALMDPRMDILSSQDVPWKLSLLTPFIRVRLL